MVNETLLHFEQHIKNSLVFRDLWKLREIAIKSSLLNDENNKLYYLEFAVFNEASSNFFSKFVKKIYCFDSFEGLSEDWAGSKVTKVVLI